MVFEGWVKVPDHALKQVPFVNSAAFQYLTVVKWGV